MTTQKVNLFKVVQIGLILESRYSNQEIATGNKKAPRPNIYELAFLLYLSDTVYKILVIKLMAIISCPECGRQVSDKALKCPQCNYPIGNLEKQESESLQVLQEKIQGVVSASGLTVKVNSVGKSLNIKLTRTEVKPITTGSYGQIWLKILPQLKTDDLKGFSQILISAYSEREINKSEWERQNDINSKGGIVPNKADIIAESVAGAYLIVGFIVVVLGYSYFSNPPRNVQTSSSPSTSSPSTSSPSISSPSISSPEYLLAGIDKQSKDVSTSELAPYTQALDQLEAKCQESRMALADLSSWTQDELKKKGVEVTHLKIMNAVYQSVQPYTTPQKCNSSFALIPIIVNK